SIRQIAAPSPPLPPVTIAAPVRSAKSFIADPLSTPRAGGHRALARTEPLARRSYRVPLRSLKVVVAALVDDGSLVVAAAPSGAFGSFPTIHRRGATVRLPSCAALPMCRRPRRPRRGDDTGYEAEDDATRRML